MIFNEEITDLKQHVGQIQSIGQLQKHLLEKNLKLVVTILSTGFTCMDWDITQGEVAGILELGIQIKLSRLEGDEILLETQFWEPVRLDQIDPIDQKDLLEKFKRGIANCIQDGY